MRQVFSALRFLLYDEMRLFTAIHFNDETIRELLRVQRELKSIEPDCNYSRVENLHLTIEFLGECDRKMQYAACLAMDELKLSPFEISVGRMGRFGSGKDGMVWAGVESEGLIELKQALDNALDARKVHYEKKEFTPHITLVRQCAISQRELDRIPISARCMIDGVSLMLSTRERGKLIYTELYTKKLRRQR